MKRTEMKLSNSGGKRALTGHLLLSNEVSTTLIGLCLIELLTKWIPWEPATTQAVSQDYRLFPTN